MEKNEYFASHLVYNKYVFNQDEVIINQRKEGSDFFLTTCKYEGHFLCRIGLYLYKYRIYGTISIYIYIKRSSFCLSTDINSTSLVLSSVKL